MKVVFLLTGHHDCFLHPEDNALFDDFNRKLKRHFYEKANGIIQKERFWYIPVGRRLLYRYVIVDSFGRAKEYQDVLVFDVCVISRRFRCKFVAARYILKRRSGSGDELYMPIPLVGNLGAPFEPYTLRELFARYPASRMVGYAPWTYRGVGYHDREHRPSEGWLAAPCNRKQLAEIMEEIRRVKGTNLKERGKVVKNKTSKQNGSSSIFVQGCG